MFVTNVNGSARYSAPSGYSSWLDYWNAHASHRAYRCGATDCHHRGDLVGAHVQKAYSSDQSWYIVPLCNSCNQRTGNFYVDEELVPVPSNL
ncbi:hypothetical protein [Prevotella herbatica]|uniref:hypothetical protein n=1 Tax=Prevotella herbatica TaxID=2801997 RepID=UPI001A92BE74|nr:hypothetical protein [Prevotella herbatica]